jgi:hypothetical protein
MGTTIYRSNGVIIDFDMPHISNRKISDKVSHKINTNLAGMFNHAAKTNNTAAVVRELLTDTEQIMLAKRLGAVYLLGQDLSNYKISQILKMSESTIARIAVSREAGAFDTIKSLLSKNTQNQPFIDVIDQIITFLPSKANRKFRGQIHNK